MVPPHVENGVRVVVMTADGSYVERAKDRLGGPYLHVRSQKHCRLDSRAGRAIARDPYPPILDLFLGLPVMCRKE